VTDIAHYIIYNRPIQTSLFYHHFPSMCLSLPINFEQFSFFNLVRTSFHCWPSCHQ
jgi:hypothetical protein